MSIASHPKRRLKKLIGRTLEPLHLRVTSLPGDTETSPMQSPNARRALDFSTRLAQQSDLRKQYYRVKRQQRHRVSLDGDVRMQVRCHLRKYSEIEETQQRYLTALGSPVNNSSATPIRVLSALAADRFKRSSEEPKESERSHRDSTGDDSLVLPSDPTVSLADERHALIRYVTSYVDQHNALPPTTLQYYQLGSLIGKGAFGKVISAVHKLTNQPVAIKTIDKTLMAEEPKRKKLFQEVLILSKIRDKRVIRLLEVFESRKHLLLVMEYANGGDLLQYTKGKGRLDESESKLFFKELAEGLRVIHQTSILHRDIKLENILLSNSHVKICDFGVSRVLQKHVVLREQCGTPAYIAPELLVDKGYEGFASDVWSLGVCLFAMVAGYLPFQGKTASELHTAIKFAQVEYPPWFSPDLKDLLSHIFLSPPKQRITLKSLLSHPWLQLPVPAPNSDIKPYHELKEIGKRLFRPADPQQTAGLGISQGVRHVCTSKE